MKIKVRLLALFMVAVLLCALLTPFAGADTGAADGGLKSQVKNKVVSVLFDDSGSMKSPIDRWNYARYALESLMSALGENDTLVITPMNESGNVTVDLKAEDRTREINRVMTQTFLAAERPGNAGTPASSIQKAVSVLKNAGMKQQTEIAADEVSDKEYFLVVLTDGQFDSVGTSVSAAAGLFAPDLSKYAFFQSIYVGFTEGALNLAGALPGYANFAAYKADTPKEIGQVMQQVANRITGRYAIDVPFDPNSKTITINLSSVPFSLRSVTVMAATTNARFASATYNGSPVKVEQDARFNPPNGMTGATGGFTAILAPSGGGSGFSGGSITLTLDEAPGADAAISVMVEPALLLTPVVTCEVNGKMETVDSAYINSHLTPGKQIFVSYILTEQYTGREVDPATLPGTTGAAVTYDGKSYAVGSGIPLKEGKKEIGVSVSMMSGAYTLYASVPCVVLSNPTYFRIEAGKPVSAGEESYETTFRVFDQNTPITAGALAGYNPAVTAADENGGPIPVTVKNNADGTFTATLDLTDRAYGTYTLRATVTKDGNPRAVETPVWFYPSGLQLTSDVSTMDVTLHGIKDNAAGFTFALTDRDGVAVSLEDKEIIGYTAKLGSLDVTEYCTVRGNLLSFVPTAEALGTLAEQTGTSTLTVTVRYLVGDEESVSASATLNILATRFEVVLLNGEDVGAVDRFNLPENEGSLYFAVLRDGVALSAEELQAALDEGLFSVESLSAFVLSPVRSTQTVEAYAGTPAVRVRISEGHIAPLRFLVTSMLTFGDSVDVSVRYGAVNAAGTVPLASPGIIPYLWRILVLLYLLQLIILALTYKSVKRVPKGTLVKLTIEGEGEEKTVTKGELVKHVRGMDRLLLPRLLPFVGLVFREKTVSVADNNVTTLRSNGAGVGVEISPYNTGKFTEYDANKPITSVTRQKYKENTTEGNLGRLKEKNITVAVKTEAKKQSGVIPLNEKEGYVTNPGGRRALLYLFIRPER